MQTFIYGKEKFFVHFAKSFIKSEDEKETYTLSVYKKSHLKPIKRH